MSSRSLTPLFFASVLFASVSPAFANLIITPTFAANINNDAVNGASIKATINAAIAIYESDFLDPINVSITFNEDALPGGVLAQSSFNLYSYSYATFHTQLALDGKSADDTAALAQLNSVSTGPVTNSSLIYIKSANAKAIGLTPPPFGGFNSPDGTITITAGQTTPGAVEHEIDEILGLGSTLGLSGQGLVSSQRSPEDFFRFSAAGVRSFDPSGSATAFFSINGSALLNQFDNAADGGDYGDWAASGQSHVQDAFSSGADPGLNVELRALDVIGYDLVAAPEPTTVWLMTAAGLGLIAFRRKLTV